jgi:phospho-N-acetylmuramoyl-pentapeptide-transferase
MVPYFRRNITLALSLVGLVVLAASFLLLANTHKPTPSVELGIAVWLGGLLAFMYFNVYPARIIMGDTGALSFGATYAVIGLILGKAFALPIIGALFVIEIATSLIQLLSKHFRKKKVFPVAPLHLWLHL